MVPPLSVTSVWSGMRSMTGCSVKTLNSLLLASGLSSATRRELDHRALQAQAQAQERDLLLARPADGAHLALDPAVAEAAGHQHAGHALQLVGHLLRLHALQLLASGSSAP